MADAKEGCRVPTYILCERKERRDFARRVHTENLESLEVNSNKPQKFQGPLTNPR